MAYHVRSLGEYDMGSPLSLTVIWERVVHVDQDTQNVPGTRIDSEKPMLCSCLVSVNQTR